MTYLHDFITTFAVLSDEVRYRLFKLLEANPHMAQREVARALGVSVGKVNYCIRSLIEKGWVKASNFRNSQNKAAYAYLLTPRGIEEKARVTLSFLQFKMHEYEILREDIEAIRSEVSRSKPAE
jgi:EPS-associated MarR family transcriptional regulator